MAAWLLPMAMAGAKGALNVWQAGEARGANEKARRTQNQARNIATKKQVRLAWKNLVYENQQDIESLNILKRNTNKYLDQQDDIAAQDWWLNRLDDLDKFDADTAAFNKSVENLETALNFNDISANIAYEEESNYMKDFHTTMKYDALESKYALDDKMTQAYYEADKAQLNVQTAMSKGASDREMLKLQNEADRATSAHQSQQEQIKGMQTKGKILATGGAGRSSRKAVQSVAAGLGQQQSMRIDALLNKNSMYKNQLKASHDNLYYQKAGFSSTMDSLQSSINSAVRDHGLSQQQAKDTLESGLASNKTRLAKISAAKYSADLAAQSQVLSAPQPPRMDPIPFKAVRPEYQEVKKLTNKDKQDFYDTHMSTLEDENKIVGDAAGKPNPWGQALGIGLDMFSAAASAGAFKGGGGTPTSDYSPTGGPLAGPGFDPSSMPGYFGNPSN